MTTFENSRLSISPQQEMIKTILQTFSEIIPVTFSVSEYTNHKMEDDPCTLYTYNISEYLIKFKLSRLNLYKKKLH